MSREKPFDFKKARRISPEEVESARKAIERKLGIALPKKSGRPPSSASGRAQPVSIRLSPLVLAWAKREAKKKGVGYQTVIKDTLERIATA